MCRYVVCLVWLLLGGCAPGPSEPGLQTISVAVERDYGVWIIDGEGRIQERIDAEWASKERLEIGYFAPAIAPRGDRLAVVRCEGIDKEYGRFQPGTEPDGGCSLRVRDLDATAAEVVLASSDTWMDSPAWSPDGRRLAVIDGRRVLLLELDSGHVASVDVPFMLRLRPLGSALQRPGYVRWHEGGDRLYLLAGRDHFAALERLDPPAGDAEREAALQSVLATMEVGGFNTVGVIEPFTLDFEWLPIRVPTFVGGEYSHHYLDIEPTGPQSGIGRLVKEEMPADPAVEALFGSARHPVWRPMRAGGGRYVFFLASDSGLMASTWLAVYDTLHGETFRVRTLKRYLYTK